MCPRRLLLLLVLVAETHSKPPSHVLSEMAASHGHSLACQQMKWMANNTPQVLLHERHNSLALLPFSAAAVEAERRPTLPPNHNSSAFILALKKKEEEEESEKRRPCCQLSVFRLLGTAVPEQATDSLGCTINRATITDTNNKRVSNS